jgi:hypothetical protein
MTGPGSTNRSAEYRRRAEEARMKASSMASGIARSAMLQAAETWERMAEYEEKKTALGSDDR